MNDLLFQIFLAMPATINVEKLKSAVKLKFEAKFFPHLSTEAAPVDFFSGGLEKVVSSTLANWRVGLEEGKEYLLGLKALLSLDLYSIS